jgi:anti-anti-sigma factor
MREPRTGTLAASLTCVLETTSQAMLVRAVGEVDLSTIPMLWSNLKAMAECNRNVVVDLNRIQYIDSAGIQALLDATQLFFQCGRRLVLAEPSPIFRMLLREIAGLEQTIPVFTSVAAALASFRSPAAVSPGPGSRNSTRTASQSGIGGTAMALNSDRNRALASLRGRAEDVNS